MWSSPLNAETFLPHRRTAAAASQGQRRCRVRPMSYAMVAGGGASAALGSPGREGAEPGEGIPRVGSALGAAQLGVSPTKYPAFQILQRGRGHFAVCKYVPAHQRLTTDTYAAKRGRALGSNYPQRARPFSRTLLTIYMVWDGRRCPKE